MGFIPSARTDLIEKTPHLSATSAVSFQMEATGVEPVSENISHKLSPGAVGLLGFPTPHGGLQPYGAGSFIIHKQGQSFPCLRSPLKYDTLSRSAVLPGRMAAII